MNAPLFFNCLLRWFGVKLVKLSSLQKMQQASSTTISDINQDKEFMELYMQVDKFTMVGIVRTYALYKALQNLLAQHVQGDMVECGVWKGGSSMLMAAVLKSRNETHRKIYLYDTFEGMAEPGAADGSFEKEEWNRLKINDNKNAWCYSPLEEVKANMQTTGFPAENIIYVKGKVEQTIPEIMPSKIALLRLDTDWYESTHHELKHLFPLLANRGILLIDDYGAWQGAKKAVDEYFNQSPYHLVRIDHSGRLLVKA